jgi:LacI family gluconate utilization system Gnt-I transcriptional repressor
MEGFRAWLANAGAACRVLADPDLTRTVQSGQILTEQLLRDGELPEVIHYLNDAMAIGGLRALFAAGLDVPRDLSVIGFNGTSRKHALRTRLTTFEVPLHQVGVQAAQAVIGAEAEVALTRSTNFVPQIIHGNTFRWAKPRGVTENHGDTGPDTPSGD